MKTTSRFYWLLALLVFWSAPAWAAKAKPPQTYLLYVGTYTTGGSRGIYAYHYDLRSGELKSLGLAAETVNPSFLVIDRKGKFLYAVNEVQNYHGELSGAVSAFSIDRDSGKLLSLNEVASRGADPCYISLDRTAKYALVANYTGGNVAVFPLSADGRIGDASSVVQDAGPRGPDRIRQEGPHAHWIEVSADNHFAYVADLGLDRVLIYKFDATAGSLSLGRSAVSASKTGSPIAGDSATLAPGSGPRHIAFSANGDFMYVLGELDSTVTVFANDGKETFRPIQKVSALPTGFSGQNTAAEIAIHPSGKFLYTSNRGNDSIAAFSIQSKTGRLAWIGNFSSGGKTPRNFEIDPAGARLLVANQDSDSIVVFRVNSETGRLTRTTQQLKVPSPVCLRFVASE
jgi:6-phosphogluconolactonase